MECVSSLIMAQVFLGRHAVEHGSFSPRSSRDDNVDRIRVESGGWETHGFSVAELDLKPKPNWGLSSRVHLLIYYAHPNGEVIADALSLRLEPCVQNLVSTFIIQFCEGIIFFLFIEWGSLSKKIGQNVLNNYLILIQLKQIHHHCMHSLLHLLPFLKSRYDR